MLPHILQTVVTKWKHFQKLGFASHQSGKDDRFHYQKIFKSLLQRQSCLCLRCNIEMSVGYLCCIIHKNSHGLLSSASKPPSKQHKVCCVVNRHSVTGARRATKKVKKKQTKRNRGRKTSGAPCARMNTRCSSASQHPHTQSYKRDRKSVV